jgi:large subunit ribosomal protein L7Ae
MAPAAKSKATAKSAPVANPLFPSKAKSFRIGADIRVAGRDLSRFVRWPRYVRLQRQKKVLLQRLKVPPALHQFDRTLDKNQAAKLFTLLNKYKPEDKAAKDARLEAAAARVAAGEAKPTGPAPSVLKFGLKHVTTLIEQKKAKMVIIAHDVDPIELVVWVPALCRKMNIPFCIVKGKSRLGVLTGKKTGAICALTSVNKEDQSELTTLCANFKAQFNDVVERKWGGGAMGLKTSARMAKRAAILEVEEAKKALALAR